MKKNNLNKQQIIFEKLQLMEKINKENHYNEDWLFSSFMGWNEHEITAYKSNKKKKMRTEKLKNII